MRYESESSFLLQELALGWAIVWWWNVCGSVPPALSATWRRRSFPVPVEWWQLQLQEQLCLQIPRRWASRSQTSCCCIWLLSAGNYWHLVLALGFIWFSNPQNLNFIFQKPLLKCGHCRQQLALNTFNVGGLDYCNPRLPWQAENIFLPVFKV